MMSDKSITCIDCKKTFDINDDNAAACSGCSNIVCEDCVMLDHEEYECSDCYDRTEQENT